MGPSLSRIAGEGADALAAAGEGIVEQKDKQAISWAR
jgi:hypothetical protein